MVVGSLLVKMRSWVDGRGGGGPFPDEESLPDMTEEVAIDRYHQHTKNCPFCSVVRTPLPDMYAAKVWMLRCRWTTASACTLCITLLGAEAVCECCTAVGQCNGCLLLAASQHCHACLQALKNFRILRIALAAASIVLASASVTSATLATVQSAAPLWFAAGAVITGAAAALCHDLARKLVFVRFRHSQYK